MIVKIHRFQPKLNKYVSKEHELVSGEEALSGGQAFLGISIDARLKPEPGFMALRTQRVDRIEVNSYEQRVDIYTSPIVVRESKGSGRAPKFSEVEREATDLLYSSSTCKCGHPKQDHSFDEMGCSVKPCGCTLIYEKETV